MLTRALDPGLLLERHIAPTFVLDRDGKVALWNKACEALTGLSSAQVLGTREHWRAFFAQARPCLADLVLTDRIEVVAENYGLMADVRGQRDTIAIEDWFVVPGNGRRLYLAVEAAAIRDETGEIAAVIETLRDLTAMKAAEARFRSLAGLDGLTGIANRRTFEDALATEWRRATRSGASLSLLLIDIDHFKQFNDQLGHQSGDACLREIARVLSEETRRAGDFPARYGGEEFAILLPATDEAGAVHIAENVRAAIERRAVRHPLSSTGPVVTASIGVASVAPTTSDNVEKLVCFADIALYRAKDFGRNRACAFTDKPPCAAARIQPTAGVDIPVIGSNFCASCRKDAPVARSF